MSYTSVISNILFYIYTFIKSILLFLYAQYHRYYNDIKLYSIIISTTNILRDNFNLYIVIPLLKCYTFLVTSTYSFYPFQIFLF